MLGRRLLGLFFDKAAPTSGANLTADESLLAPSALTYHHIWRQLRRAGATPHPTDRGRTNVLVLQMGKVASKSIRAALTQHDLNVFHSHGLSHARQDHDLDRLRRGDLTVELASHRLTQNAQNLCLHMLVRWYRENNIRHRRKLKVITLTRDPVTRIPSSFMQQRKVARPQIQAWQSVRLRSDPAALDDAVALRDFVMELASIVVEARPSSGADGCSACERLARDRWPGHYVVEEVIDQWLRPLTWFDTEIRSVFGVDVLAVSGLTQRGWAEVSTDFADILVLQFEKLGAVATELARFLDLPELTLPVRNASSDKHQAAATIAIIKEALSTPVGRACVQELRLSRYAQACGYAAPAQMTAV